MARRLPTSRSLEAISALAGGLSPLVLATATLIVAHGRRDYSHLSQTLSELGTDGRPGAVLMRYAGVIPAGLLTVCAARAVRVHVGDNPPAMGAAWAVGLGGVFLAATGLAPWHGPAGVVDLSLIQNQLHLLFALGGFLVLALAPLLAALALRHAEGRRSWQLASLAAALVVFCVAFWPAPAGIRGAFQRVSLGVFYLWLWMACGQAWRRARSMSLR